MENLDEIIKKHLNRISEQQKTENYMFFSNLEQIQRQCKMLLEIDPMIIETILQDGHDWADDHVSESKNNMDQVFDFFMNTTKESLNEINDINEGKNKPTNPKLWQQSLTWARSRYKVCPSAYCNGAAAKRYKQKGGKWKKK